MWGKGVIEIGKVNFKQKSHLVHKGHHTTYLNSKADQEKDC